MKESLENRFEDGVINIVQTFCGVKEIGIMVMTRTRTMCIIKIRDFKKFVSTSLPGKPLNGIS